MVSCDQEFLTSYNEDPNPDLKFNRSDIESQKRMNGQRSEQKVNQNAFQSSQDKTKTELEAKISKKRRVASVSVLK